MGGRDSFRNTLQICALTKVALAGPAVTYIYSDQQGEYPTYLGVYQFS